MRNGGGTRVEHGNAELREDVRERVREDVREGQGAADDRDPAASRDLAPGLAAGRDPARDPAAGQFLSDLRALRAQVGLDQGELAARAHFPRYVIAAAEAALPKLPVLAAYVRGCGGSADEVVDWEDRWRSVTGTPARPLMSARVAGLSGAASAGAQLAAASPPVSPEKDPTVILAALHRFADQMAQPTPDSAAAPAQDSAAGVSARDAVGGTTANSAGETATVRGKASPATPASSATSGASPVAGAPTGSGMAAPAHREAGHPGGQSGAGAPGTSGKSRRTIAVAVVAAVVLCLIIILLVL